MVFNSLPFLIFLPAVVFLYYLLPHRLRWVLLLLASYFFYGFWKVEYLALIMISTVVDFFAARLIASSNNPLRKLTGLSASLAVNLGLLFFFKYSGWFMNDVLGQGNLLGSETLNQFNEAWKFALPVGISFYTFQTLSYTIDVFFGRVKPETNPLKFALFVSFFPQLVAGPIERFSKLHHQLFQLQKFTYENFQHGGRLILFGLFIKMCVADNIAPVVNQVFAQQEDASSMQLLSGMLLFGLQIYSDFHGYSLIAIGSARLLGIQLMDNFNSPYSAHSVREFWTRWHISLSTWFRDYVFIPLGGSRVNQLRWAANILVVFTVSGLWHGANWTFVTWGAIHGIAYLIEKYSGVTHLQHASIRPLRWIVTMTIVFVAWVFFRSDSVTNAWTYISRMISGSKGWLALDWSPMLITFIGLFLFSDIVFRSGNMHAWLREKPFAARWSVYGFLIYSIMAYSGTVNHPFIYFQF